MSTTDDFTSIAIIGLSCRCPGARNADLFWENIAGGVESITPLSDQELLDAGVSPLLLSDPRYVKVANLIDEVDTFDAELFGITPREAEAMNPQHRVLLECAWEALEHAGYGNSSRDTKIGVFVGESLSNYSTFNLFSRTEPGSQARYLQNLVGNDKDFLATYISYKLNLRGPSLGVQTACSTSLVSVSLACQYLLSYGADMALAGGITIRLPQKSGYLHEPGSIFSPDGHCRSFAADSQGTVFGSGAGIVVLKRLDDAIEDRDNILAVIKGSAVNNDGSIKAGFTAPGLDGQAEVIAMAMAMAGIPAESIGYVEAHGTGTPIGDPIEVAALTQAFRQSTDRKGFCALGSVKTNVGHLESAAGVASLIKTVYALKNKQLPPSLHFHKANPEINFPDSPFYVNTKLSPWASNGYPRRAGVSSFGIGGTNAHVILEEPPARVPEVNAAERPLHILALSAGSTKALRELAERYRDHLKRNPGVSLPDLCFTANTGRVHLDHRLAAVAISTAQLCQQLDGYVDGKGVPGLTPGNGEISSRTRVFFDPSDRTASDAGDDLVLQLIPDPDWPRLLNRLARLYVEGAEVEWSGFDQDRHRFRVELPTYPFQRKRYWLQSEDLGYRRGPGSAAAFPAGRLAPIHPLLDKNVSTLEEQAFVTDLNGGAFYPQDHTFNNDPVLPGAVSLEMARAAGQFSMGRPVKRIREVVWLRPLLLSQSGGPTAPASGQEVRTRLSWRQGAMEYEIVNESTLICQGKLYFEDEGLDSSPGYLEIAAIQKRVSRSMSGEECYGLFQKKGMGYGRGFQTLSRLDYNETEALALLALPEKCRNGFTDFVLHPSLVDGAWQAVLGLVHGLEIEEPMLPFSLEEMEIVGPLTGSCYAYVRSVSGRKSDRKGYAFDICLADENGKVALRLQNFYLRPLQQRGVETGEAVPGGSIETIFYRRGWLETNPPPLTGSSPLTGPLLIFAHDDSFCQALQAEAEVRATVILVTPGPRFQEPTEEIPPRSLRYEINPGHWPDFDKLLISLQKRGLAPSRILHVCQHDHFALDEESIRDEIRESLQAGFHLAQGLMQQRPGKAIRFIYLHSRRPGDEPHPVYASLSAFAKCLILENHRFIAKTVEITTGASIPARDIIQEFHPELDMEREVRFEHGRRWVRHLVEADLAAYLQEPPPLFRPGGVYLISGGLGALGLIFARYLAEKVQARLILVNRSEFGPDQELQIKELEQAGSEVLFVRADVASREEVARVLSLAKQRFKEVNGVIHAAGVVRDALVLKKREQEIFEVTDPKVLGTVHLDELFKDEPLDFFILFSSLVSVFGNIGQADYAFANDFLGRFAGIREGLRSLGARPGRTLAIHWPYWQEGGLPLAGGFQKRIQEATGMHPISTAEGIRIFEQALAAPDNQVIAVRGERKIIEQYLLSRVSPDKDRGDAPQQVSDGQAPEAGERLREKTEEYLRNLIHAETGIPVHKINAQKPLEEYGIDSLMILNLNSALEKDFGPLSKVLFFEYQTLTDLSLYFIESYAAQLREILDLPADRMERNEEGPEVEATGSTKPLRLKFQPDFAPLKQNSLPGETDGGQIAVIGVGGQYPLASDLDEFWENLKQGKDCISEIPAWRWDQRLFFDQEKGKPGKAYAKWGGFITDVDRFDPVFFNISPREAELMDPQERLFLKTAWETLEDSAWTRADLRGSKVGVFVGVMWGEYQLYGAANGLEEALKPSSSYATIANRVSYFFDFQGPSIALDTMCSSSLTAIHLACESIRRGECDLALAGGVNVSVHPNKFILLSQGRFASTDGRCRSFGSGGDGYVPGEGVGAVLLKPLSRAVADNDRIYGIIRATSINHGGKTNNYTVPNPKLQRDLIGETLKKAGIDPQTVSYIEAHGTGTVLGDPIEIASLTKSFREYTTDNQFCAIGSVKSNIGHCESAAGIAGLTKVLLQLKHGLLVPSLHAEELNPNIDFSSTPFIVQQQCAEWKRPRVHTKGEIREVPRIAGISSFGAGGANAHLIVEEYIPRHGAPPQIGIPSPPPAIIVLSAKNAAQLRQQVERLLQFMAGRHLSDADLPAMAFTLQTGREAMEERLAVMVQSIQELREKLGPFLEGRQTVADLYLGRVRENEVLADLRMNDDMEKTVGAWIDKGKYSRLLGLWVKGLAFDWRRIYRHAVPNRIQLPTYPFAEERYWVGRNQDLGSGTEGGLGLQSERLENRVAAGSSPGRACFLKKHWLPCLPGSTRKVTGIIAILANRQTISLARLLTGHLASSQILDLDDSTSLRQRSKQEWQDFGGCVDLCGCAAEKSESLAWIEWLQELIENGHRNGLMLLGVTKGLESFQNSAVNLAGALRAGLYRMLQSEYRHLFSRHMDAEPAADDHDLARLIAAEFGLEDSGPEVCYRRGERYRASLREERQPEETGRKMTFPEDQVLLITGGTRGLGYLCAQHFVKSHGVKRLVLAGREAIPPRDQWQDHKLQDSPVADKIKAIELLESHGAQVLALSISLTDEEALAATLREIKEALGPVAGIIHCAGSIDTENPAFIRKPLAGIKQVLAPKVHGLDHLYRIFRHEPLQFFVLFSSVSGTIPSLSSGQSDYAMANAYLDYFAESVASDCPMVSIQWPNWKETGMGEVANPAYRQAGFLSLTNAEGLTLLDQVMQMNPGAVIMPAMINPALWQPDDLLRRVPVGASQPSGLPRASQPAEASAPSATLGQAARTWLLAIVSKELRLEPRKLDLDRNFQEYGMDSVLIAQIVTRMEKELGIEGIEPSAVIEYPTIKLFAEYLTLKHAVALEALTARDHSPDDKVVTPQQQEGPPALSGPRISSATIQADKEGIAVIGMACHFPDAADIGEYWENLKSAKDSIREVPTSRWEWRKYYDPDGPRPGKSISKWGAFLSEIEDFDPGYFHISEALAPQIDPLQRQWLEVSAEAMADAGYDKQALWGKQVGVFAGARSGDFAFKFSARQEVKNRVAGIGQNFITAHLAHIYNLKGPNMVVDTACSSSLTAIHLAIKSLRDGEAEIALAGGVDILLDETVFLGLSAAQVLSPDGRSRPFDAEANGIGLGEGCGVIVLKPLAKAIADHDKIYAVIRGSAVNNDGNTMGVTTPNPEAQKALIKAAMGNAAIPPESITYMETHGTGTLIGDPIELKALTGVFAAQTDRRQFCGVGSVKSNIGHLLSAAGAAGIIKVILSINQAQLPPSLHCRRPNPRFNFEQSPLYPVTELKEWTSENTFLRAGISAFGLGGNNAHIILSNEGIPHHLKATLEPKGEKIVFQRQRYWPEQAEGKRKKYSKLAALQPDEIPGSNLDEERDFLEFFEPITGR